MSPTRDVRRGFTLVELLVVISIIGVLMGLLLPAINSARESGRKTQCMSNLKNLGYAALQHLDKNRRFPTGGWGPLWVGYPDGGSGTKQPGGWVYNLLPYLEETALHDLGQGLAIAQDTTFQTDMARQVSTTQSIMSCPTRRAPQGWTAIAAMNPYDPVNGGTIDLNAAAGGAYQNKVARGDYAANAGVLYVASGSVPSKMGTQGPNNEVPFGCYIDPTTASTSAGSTYPSTYASGTSGTAFNTNLTWTGVMFQRSNIGEGSIKDGMSRTYMIGEKFVDRRYTETGQYYGDSGNMYTGMGADNYRTTYVLAKDYTVSSAGVDDSDPGNPTAVPTTTDSNATMLTDQTDANNLYGCLFGSAHSGGVVNFTFCDGSTKTISAGIDPLTHRYLGERNDGKILDDAVIGQ